MLRLTALITPVVTVFEKPKGLPIAITVSPIIRSLPDAIFKEGKGCFVSIRRTARSEAGSAPIILAVNSRSSFNTTLIIPAFAIT